VIAEKYFHQLQVRD